MAETKKSSEEIRTIITTLREQGVEDKDMGKALAMVGVSKEEAMPFLTKKEAAPAPQEQAKSSGPKQTKKADSAPSNTGSPKSILDENGLFKAFTETIKLPSAGFFYPDGQDSVEIKHLTAQEDDILFSPELIKMNKQLHAILNSAVVDPNIKAEDMLTGDRNYLLVQLRRTGFGDEYSPGPMVCSTCGHIHNPTVDLSRLNMKKMKYKPDENGEFVVELPFTKTMVKFRLLTGKDEQILNDKGLKDFNRSSGGFKADKVWTEKYLLQIMEVKGIRDKVLIKSFIEAMPLRDSKYFREYVGEIESGIDLNYEFTCPACYTSETRIVPINMRLFYPDAEI